MGTSYDNNKEFILCGCAFPHAPVLIKAIVAECSDGCIVTMPPSFPFANKWGKSNSIVVYDNPVFSPPVRLYGIYLSLVEQRFYLIDFTIPTDTLSTISDISDNYKIIIGMGPCGRVAIWAANTTKQILLGDIETTHIPTQALGVSDNEQQRLRNIYAPMIDDISEQTITQINKLMSQYNYKYHIDLNYDNNQVSVINKFFTNNTDGTFDMANDKLEFIYHYVGKPEKLMIEWNIGKSTYTAYYWLDRTKITEIFERFYGAHPETKADFIIKIDAEKKKYELSLYRQGLKEPVIIPESAYQLIVFKNKFEDYRSENYDKPRGAWIW